MRKPPSYTVIANKEKSVRKLTELYGVKTRVASAILTFYNPEKFGVVDVKAWKALYNEAKEDFEPEDYVKYLKDIRELAKKCYVTPRNVDLALWYMDRMSRTQSRKVLQRKNLKASLRR